MATAPQYAATVNLGLAIPSASAMGGTLIAPTNTTTLFTAGASGSRLDILRILQTASSSAGGVLNFFIVRSSVFYLLDMYQFGIVTISATAQPQPIDIYYNALELKTGDTIAVVNTVSSATAGQWVCLAMGGDF
jgi:hypothetical protein